MSPSIIDIPDESLGFGPEHVTQKHRDSARRWAALVVTIVPHEIIREVLIPRMRRNAVSYPFVGERTFAALDLEAIEELLGRKD